MSISSSPAESADCFPSVRHLFSFLISWHSETKTCLSVSNLSLEASGTFAALLGWRADGDCSSLLFSVWELIRHLFEALPIKVTMKLQMETVAWQQPLNISVPPSVDTDPLESLLPAMLVLVIQLRANWQDVVSVNSCRITSVLVTSPLVQQMCSHHRVRKKTQKNPHQVSVTFVCEQDDFDVAVSIAKICLAGETMATSKASTAHHATVSTLMGWYSKNIPARDKHRQNFTTSMFPSQQRLYFSGSTRENETNSWNFASQLRLCENRLNSSSSTGQQNRRHTQLIPTLSFTVIFVPACFSPDRRAEPLDGVNFQNFF